MEDQTYLQDILKCVRCGSCNAYCPTYDEDETEAMAARGRLALLRELSLQRLSSTPLLNERIFSCILCGACRGLCPSRVDVMEDIFHGRAILRQNDKRRNYLRAIAKLFVGSPYLSFKVLHLLQYILFPFLEKKGFIPPRLGLPESPFKESHRVYKPLETRGRVALFTGCSVNFLYPHLGFSLLNILLKSGYEIIVPGGEVCCGMPLRALGLEKEASELAEKNMRIFGKLNVEAVLSLCPTCTLTIKEQYPKLIGSGIKKAEDVSSFLSDRLKFDNKSYIAWRFKKAAYHDPCHLLYGLGVKKQPRDLLKNMGVEIIEGKDGCCGFGGSFSISNKDISDRLLQKCAENFSKTGAEAIVTACPGCIIQLSKAVNDMPVFHIVELIEEAYCHNDEV